jgi:hypothetical protein
MGAARPRPGFVGRGQTLAALRSRGLGEAQKKSLSKHLRELGKIAPPSTGPCLKLCKSVRSVKSVVALLLTGMCVFLFIA